MRWGSKIQNILDANHQPVKAPVVGGVVVVDSTPRFGTGGRGEPCDDEHHDVCSGPGGAWRHCEDPRGGQWTVLTGPARVHVLQPGPDYGFQGHVQIQRRGTVRVKVCPPPNLRDGEDPPQPVKLAGGDPCSTVSFTVK